MVLVQVLPVGISLNFKLKETSDMKEADSFSLFLSVFICTSTLYLLDLNKYLQGSFTSVDEKQVCELLSVILT